MLMTFEIEANIGCCGACRRNVEQNLSRIKGVESVTVHPENKVTVKGNVKPEILLDEVRKIKKTARLLLRKEFSLESGPPLAREYDSIIEKEMWWDSWDMKEIGGALEPARDDASKDDAMKDPSSSSLSKVARGLWLVAGYLSPWSMNRGTSTRVCPEEESSDKSALTSQSERVGMEINVMGLGRKISYRKDASYT